MVRLCLVLKEPAKASVAKTEFHCEFSRAMKDSSCCSASSKEFGGTSFWILVVVSGLNFSHSNRCVVTAHCFFFLWNSLDIWCWICFHILFVMSICNVSYIYISYICILYIFVDEMFLLPIFKLGCLFLILKL